MREKCLLIAGFLFVLFGLIVVSKPVQALGDVRIVSHSSFYSILNTLYVVGEVENTGDMATKFTKVTATFYNSLNQVIAMEYGYASLDILLPGRKSPFSVMLHEWDGSLNVHNYTLSVSWDNYAAGKALGLEILSSSNYTDEYGNFHVTGEIENQGTLEARYAKAFVTFYDSDGVVVGEDSDFTDPTHIPPSEKGAFDVELIYDQQVMKVASYSLSAESLEYGLIPEFPMFLILPLFVITTLLIIILRNTFGQDCRVPADSELQKSVDELVRETLRGFRPILDLAV